ARVAAEAVVAAARLAVDDQDRELLLDRDPQEARVVVGELVLVEAELDADVARLAAGVVDLGGRLPLGVEVEALRELLVADAEAAGAARHAAAARDRRGEADRLADQRERIARAQGGDGEGLRRAPAGPGGDEG